MPRYERVQTLFEVLWSSRRPRSMSALCEAIGASRATVNRLIAFLRDHQRLDIRYDRPANGYYLHRDDGVKGAASLMALTPQEASALLEAISILEQIPPGLVRNGTSTIRSGLNRLRRLHLGNDRARELVQLRLHHTRRSHPATFNLVLDVLRTGTRLQFHYQSRGSGESGTRTVSPVRLILYRSNWYLAAWCHKRDGLRLFSLDRMTSVQRLSAAAYRPNARVVAREFDTSYGIFPGEANRTAVLRFTPVAARWVAEETWHPNATTEVLPDGGVRLAVPYRLETELVMEVLRHGPECIVEAPPSLRRAVIRSLRLAIAQYNGKT